MLLAVLANYFILLIILGYSFFLKKIIYKYKEFKVENKDILYGLIFLLFISLFFNFFFPLDKIRIFLILSGFIIFIFGLYKKTFKINFFLYFLIIFFTTFIAFYNGINIDSPMYHLQIIKWLNLHKISFGISNLEIRLGFNSSWHSIISLLDISFGKFSLKYYLGSIFLGIIIYEVTKIKEKFCYSDLFLFLTISFLIFYSFLHPFSNGVILNHLGNPERDIAGMLFFFLSIYFFLKSLETNFDHNIINLLIISVFLCVTTRPTMAPIFLLLIFILLKKNNYKILNFINIFIFFTGFLWVLRSFFLSGCLLFPFNQTCFSTSWSVNINEVKFFVEEAMRYTRTLPTLNGLTDLEFSLNSYNWMGQWIREYFLSAAILQIGTCIILISIFILIISKLFKVNYVNKSISISDGLIFITLIIIIFFWFISAPETRYALGPIISLPCFFIYLVFKRFKMLELILNKSFYFSISLSILCLLLFSKNVLKFNNDDIFANNYKIPPNYSHIKKIGTFNNKDFYWGDFKCIDFEKICVNTVKQNYSIENIFNYKVYKSN